MTDAPGHHLFLRDEEVQIIIEALDQYESAETDGRHRRGETEQLARLIQRGTGITGGFVRGTDRAQLRTHLDEQD